jgi:decaprenylphospho-beta-D-erythro-pentofuranosid-2-ulose 2-reductase
MTEAPRILILGGASAISVAYARLCAGLGARFILAGRHRARLAAVADDLRVRGAAAADIFPIDFSDMDAFAGAAKDIRARFGAPDEIFLAYGALGDQAAAERDLAQARATMEIDYVSPALLLLALLSERDATKPLRVVVIGSVAGDRGRAANYIYGSAKGGLEIFVEGLRQEYCNEKVQFTFVKPGVVDTPMTAHIGGGPLRASPEAVAAAIAHAVAQGSRAVYAPWFWRPIMVMIRYTPWFLFKRFRV